MAYSRVHRDSIKTGHPDNLSDRRVRLTTDTHHPEGVWTQRLPLLRHEGAVRHGLGGRRYIQLDILARIVHDRRSSTPSTRPTQHTAQPAALAARVGFRQSNVPASNRKDAMSTSTPSVASFEPPGFASQRSRHRAQPSPKPLTPQLAFSPPQRRRRLSSSHPIG